MDSRDDELSRLLDAPSLDPKRAAELAVSVGDAAEFLRRSRSSSTLRAYQTDWKQFATWIESHGLEALPADPRMVALWLGHMARALARRPSSIRRMIATINVVHKRAGFPSPCANELVREEFAGICRVLGTRQQQAAPLLVGHLEALVASMGDDLRAQRDKAVLLVGWAGALRRSEITALRVEHLSFMDKGVRVLLERSKTDQTGEGQHVALFFAQRIALCPVRALQRWLAAADVREGYVFRTLSRGRSSKAPAVRERPIADKTVDSLVKRWALRAGLQPEQLGDGFSAHSLRAGFITEAARGGKPEWSIQKQSRHRSTEVLRRYIRLSDVFDGNAGEGLL